MKVPCLWTEKIFTLKRERERDRYLLQLNFSTREKVKRMMVGLTYTGKCGSNKLVSIRNAKHVAAFESFGMFCNSFSLRFLK